MNITVCACLLGCVRSAPRMPLGQLRQLIIGAYSQNYPGAFPEHLMSIIDSRH